MNIRTKRGAIRRYNALISACYRDARGGTEYGIDWPTLRILWPDRYNELKRIQKLYSTLPA